MNKAFISGNLTHDPEIRETTTGRKVANITIAVNGPKRQDGTHDTDFIRCVLWDQKAEFAEKWCFKGQPVTVEGRIAVRKYDQNGETRTATEIVVANIEPHKWPERGEPQFANNDPFAF